MDCVDIEIAVTQHRRPMPETPPPGRKPTGVPPGAPVPEIVDQRMIPIVQELANDTYAGRRTLTPSSNRCGIVAAVFGR